MYVLDSVSPESPHMQLLDTYVKDVGKQLCLHIDEIVPVKTPTGVLTVDEADVQSDESGVDSTPPQQIHATYNRLRLAQFLDNVYKSTWASIKNIL